MSSTRPIHDLDVYCKWVGPCDIDFTVTKWLAKDMSLIQFSRTPNLPGCLECFTTPNAIQIWDRDTCGERSRPTRPFLSLGNVCLQGSDEEVALHTNFRGSGEETTCVSLYKSEPLHLERPSRHAHHELSFWPKPSPIWHMFAISGGSWFMIRANHRCGR
jgi:hypothetical protein